MLREKRKDLFRDKGLKPVGYWIAQAT